MSRHEKLLQAAADALADCRDPFNEGFLIEHNVTLTECMDLSRKIAIILTGYLESPKDVQAEIMIRGVTKGEIAPEAVDYAISRQKASRTAEEIARINRRAR